MVERVYRGTIIKQEAFNESTIAFRDGSMNTCTAYIIINAILQLVMKLV